MTNWCIGKIIICFPFGTGHNGKHDHCKKCNSFLIYVEFQGPGNIEPNPINYLSFKPAFNLQGQGQSDYEADDL